MFVIDEELKRLPNRPGVYIMRDEAEVVIYVGKAINLKNRVRSYFQHGNDFDPKVRGIRYYIKTFEYIVTNTEVEALILENNLIKRYMPRFNVMLKDDKTYPFIKFTKEDFPRMFVTRRFDRDQSKYFGPFASKYAVDKTVEVMRGVWALRLCDKPIFDSPKYKKTRPCLNYHIGRCLGPCGGKVTKEAYTAVAEEAYEFLGGRHAPIIRRLEQEMRGEADKEDFERAAIIRDKIFAIKSLEEKQTTDVLTTGDMDVFAIARGAEEAVAQVFFMREGKLTGREHFLVESGENGKSGEDFTDGELLRGVVSRFYGGTPLIPKEIALDIDVPELESLENDVALLRGGAVAITVPKAGDKKQLCNLARENAQVQLEQFAEHMKREFERTRGAAKEIRDALNMETDLERIEAYDISNVQGTDSVGSMVVFESGKPKRSEYRKFKIKTVKGANDFASMDEVLTRRFTRYINEKGMAGSKFGHVPDLILMDGGKPQIAAAEGALEKLGLFIPVCGMVKDDKHRTRALMFNGEERKMLYTSEGFKLVTRIQDEVHRFAIEYHRKLRQKSMTKSVLDDIKGIGAARREALMRHFKSIDKIRAASLEELQKAEGMNKPSAKAVFDFFHGVEE